MKFIVKENDFVVRWGEIFISTFSILSIIFYKYRYELLFCNAIIFLIIEMINFNISLKKDLKININDIIIFSGALLQVMVSTVYIIYSDDKIFMLSGWTFMMLGLVEKRYNVLKKDVIIYFSFILFCALFVQILLFL